MTDRLLAGFHPTLGTNGFYLSRPSVDVKFATLTSDYLLRPEAKNEQVIMSGLVSLPVGSGQVDVPYPATLPQRPYVMFRPYNSFGAAAMHYDLNMAAHDLTIGGVLTYEISCGITLWITQAKMSFINASDTYALYVDYLVFNRSIGV